jgi:hypothetical protein
MAAVMMRVKTQPAKKAVQQQQHKSQTQHSESFGDAEQQHSQSTAAKTRDA